MEITNSALACYLQVKTCEENIIVGSLQILRSELRIIDGLYDFEPHRAKRIINMEIDDVGSIGEII